jgi:hypothetical protein
LVLFPEKPKNLWLLARAVRQRLLAIIKSFLVLFFKKELLSFSWRGSDMGQP